MDKGCIKTRINKDHLRRKSEYCGNDLELFSAPSIRAVCQDFFFFFDGFLFFSNAFLVWLCLLSIILALLKSVVCEFVLALLDMLRQTLGTPL